MAPAVLVSAISLMARVGIDSSFIICSVFPLPASGTQLLVVPGWREEPGLSPEDVSVLLPISSYNFHSNYIPPCAVHLVAQSCLTLF